MKKNGISFKQFNRIAPTIIRSRKPIMGHGPHGIGKSALAYQLADKLADILGDDFKSVWGDGYIFPVIERRASQMASTGPSPTFLTAPSPKRIHDSPSRLSSIVKPQLL